MNIFCLQNVLNSILSGTECCFVIATLNPYSSIYVLDKNSGPTHGEAGRILKGSPTPKPKASISLDRTDIFATVLFTEFLKELAAFAQEHSILSYIPMEE